MLTADQRRHLLSIAHASIERQVRGGTPVEAGTMVLPDASGVFVTIKERGRLRGCLGTLQNRAGLAAEVSRCAADSASEDPRFPPVAVDELPDLSLEISVLGPLEEIEARPGAFTIGGHGLVVEQGSHRGLLLPRSRRSGAGTPNNSCVRPASRRGFLPTPGGTAPGCSGSRRKCSATDAAARRAPLHRRGPASRRRPCCRDTLRGAADFHQVGGGRWRARVLPPDEIVLFRRRVAKTRSNWIARLLAERGRLRHALRLAESRRLTDRPTAEPRPTDVA